MASGTQPFAREELATIATRTLLVPGIDPTHPRDVARVYEKHLAKCRVREAGPAELATAIGDFLDDE